MPTLPASTPLLVLSKIKSIHHLLAEILCVPFLFSSLSVSGINICSHMLSLTHLSVSLHCSLPASSLFPLFLSFIYVTYAHSRICMSVSLSSAILLSSLSAFSSLPLMNILFCINSIDLYHLFFSSALPFLFLSLQSRDLLALSIFLSIWICHSWMFRLSLRKEGLENSSTKLKCTAVAQA